MNDFNIAPMKRDVDIPAQDLSRITYVAAPRDEPAGINMEDFIM